MGSLNKCTLSATCRGKDVDSASFRIVRSSSEEHHPNNSPPQLMPVEGIDER